MVVSDKSSAWLKIQQVNAKNKRRSMAESIRGRASMIAPRLSGDLGQNGRVEEKGSDTSTIVFGDENVPYARRRNFENKKNPQTLNYLKNAADQLFKESAGKWFK